MNYELAKQLKDAGFRQTGKGEILDANKDAAIDPNSAYAPTLEELIEACPTFRSLEVTSSTLQSKTWEACSLTGFCFNGATPSTALAHFWLALNN